MGPMKQTLVGSLAIAIEIVLLALVIGPVWAFGAVHPPFELWVAYGIGSSLLLTGTWLVMRGKSHLFATPTAGRAVAALYVLFLLAFLQSLPIGQTLVSLVSPGVAYERSELLPQTHETLRIADQPGTLRIADTSRTSLSLNPRGSYDFAVRLLGLTALFTAVCALCAGERSSSTFGSFLFRLSIVGAALGAALAVFSIGQHFGGPPTKLYWFYDVKSQGFGPFLNRNHYPFFANMTLGLAIGLLLKRYERRNSGWVDLLINDVMALWIIGGIVFIMAGIVVCGSRGGFVAMVAAILVGLAARFQSGSRLSLLLGVAGLGGVVLLVLSWVGFDAFASRLNTLTNAEEIRESGRFYLWASAIQAAMRFPLFGSGGETYTFWESMYSQSAAWNSSIHQATRCDNEFFDLLCEYGIFACLAAVLLAVGTLRHGLRSAKNNGLATGALIAMTGVMAHSCLDFGLRAPASAVLATVIAAALCSLPKEPVAGWNRKRRKGRWADAQEVSIGTGRTGMAAESDALRKPGPAPFGLEGNSTAGSQLGAIGIALACVLVTLFLVNEKRRIAAADAAYQLGLRAMIDGELDVAADELERSTRVTSEDAKRHRDVAGRLLDLAKMTSEPSQKLSLRQRAVQHAIVARDQSPLAYEPHLYLGQQYDLLSAGDPQINYFERAQHLHPSNCDIAYALGSLHYEQGNFDKAWPAWHASLEFIPNHLAQILDRSVKQLSAAEVIEHVLPAKPALLVRAAEYSDRVGRSDDARIYLVRVAEMLEQSSKDAAGHELLGRVYAQLQQTDKAIEAYRAAISFDPGKMDWRMELVKLLIKAEKLEEAQREVRSLLVFEPDNVTVQAMKTRVEELMREARRKK